MWYRYPNATLKVTGQRWTLIRCRALLRDLGITDRWGGLQGSRTSRRFTVCLADVRETCKF